MKLLVVCALIAVVAAAPQPQDVQLLKYESDNDGIGTYSFEFEQSDGSRRNEKGELKNAGTDDEVLVMKGSYFWISPEGNAYEVNYVADENGFQSTIDKAIGDNVPPAVAAAILG